MNLLRLCCLLLCLGPVCAFADPDDAALQSADQAFQAGHYEDAAQQFQQLIATRGYSAPLCFDLGNAEMKAGHLGQALLNYERARYLAPGDSGINHNLQLARSQAGLAPDPYRWWQIVIRSINWTVWAGVVVTCLLLLLVALVGNFLANKSTRQGGKPQVYLRRIFRGIFFVCIPLFLFFAFVELSAVGFNDRLEGVIIGKAAILRLSPFASAEKTGALPEGELVTVEQHHDHYLWVDDRSRQSGWLIEQDLAPIVPGSW